jgi:rhodanese-related sulfurtransferase
MSRNGRVSLLGAALVGALTLAGCTATSDDVGLDPETAVLDVRTPAEYAQGHLETAVSYDVQSPDFAARVDELDPEGSYVVYCRSGSRAGVAVDYLQDLGFDDVRNLGGIEDAAEVTGLEVVT